MNNKKNKEILNLLYKSYIECCDYLKKKYGKVNGNYFLTESFKSVNSKIKRTKEGLYIHHLDEDKAIMLSNKEYAIKNTYKYQLHDRLVYCNLLEHLILHIKIMEHPHKNKNINENVGIGGVVNFIVPELNDIYSGAIYTGWRKPSVELIRNLEDTYIQILDYFINKSKIHKIYKLDSKETRTKILLSSYIYNINHDSNKNISIWTKIIKLYDKNINKKNINKILEESQSYNNKIKSFMQIVQKEKSN